MAKFKMQDLLNSQSKAISSAEGASGFAITEIPIDKIVSSPSNKYGTRDIYELAASIEEIGLLHNLVVKAPDEDGKYELISGERRYLACKMIYESGNEAFALVPCKIEDGGDSPENELKLLYANATSRVLTDYEKTYQAGRIMELLKQMKQDGHKFKGRMREIVAEMIDVSPAQMGRMERINEKLSDEGKKEFEAGNIGITEAYELSGKTKEEQVKTLSALHEPKDIEVKKHMKELKTQAKKRMTNYEALRNGDLKINEIAELLSSVVEIISGSGLQGESIRKTIITWLKSESIQDVKK